jgi:sugar lactone lactonase YvrE
MRLATTAVSSLLFATISFAATSDYTVSTIAGHRDPGFSDGSGDSARFSYPSAVCVDSDNSIYVADSANQVIRRVVGPGIVTTVAGVIGEIGSNDGAALSARFSTPSGIACRAGEVFVADSGNGTIRRIYGGQVTTIAGRAGQFGAVDDFGSEARFALPTGVAIDIDGSLFVADTSNHTIRRVAPNGEVTTIAGLAGYAGFRDGFNDAARFYAPRGLAFDRNGILFVADSENHAIRAIARTGQVKTIAGDGRAGSIDDSGNLARFDRPVAIAIDSSGEMFVADANNHLIRSLDSSGATTTLAGVSKLSGFSDGNATQSLFDYPFGVAVDARGHLVVADMLNHALRSVDPKIGRRRGVIRP